MRILVISPVGTHPVTAGNRKIILQYTSLFKHWGHEVYFLHIRLRSFRKEMRDRQWEEIQGTSSYWENHYIPFHEGSTSKLYRLFLIRYRRYFCKNYFKCDDTYPMGLCHFVNKLNEEYHFDACVVNYYMFSKVLNHVHIPRKALFTHDFFSYKDLVVGFKAGYATTPNEEAKAMQRAPYIFAMQDEEAAFFQRLSPLSKVLVNYSNYEYHFQPIIGNHNILFLSGPNIFNVNGIKWFISDILPEIITIYPDVKLIIGGGICKELIKIYEVHSHIKFYGIVDDLDDFFKLGDVAINPTFQGTGLKIKTFEYLSFDKVTIVHPHSTIGIFKKDLSPLFVAKDVQDWVKALRHIWSDGSTIHKIKLCNRKYITDMNAFVEAQYAYFLTNKTQGYENFSH